MTVQTKKVQVSNPASAKQREYIKLLCKRIADKKELPYLSEDLAAELLPLLKQVNRGSKKYISYTGDDYTTYMERLKK